MKYNDRVAIIVLNDFDYSPQLHTVGGVIYVLINDNIAFPENDWFDLPVSMVNMWLSVLIDKTPKSKSVFKLFFLDGPYYIKCYKNHESLKLVFIDNRDDNENELCAVTLLFSDFVHAIVQVAKKLIAEVTMAFGDALYKNEVLTKIDVIEKQYEREKTE